MEERVCSYRVIGKEVPSICCLKTIEKISTNFPGKNFKCNSCGETVKCEWLDFNKSMGFGMSVTEQKFNKDDFIALSVIVIRRDDDKTDDLANKFRALNKAMPETDLDILEKIDSSDGREFIINKGIEVSGIRVIKLANDIFAYIGQSEEKGTGATFIFGGGGRGRKQSLSSLALGGGSVSLNPQSR